MPFTGLEFGKIILNELGLNDVKIEKSFSIDHYDLSEKKVKVSENRLSRKSLTAISIICLLYTSPSPRDPTKSRMPSSA